MVAHLQDLAVATAVVEERLAFMDIALGNCSVLRNVDTADKHDKMLMDEVMTADRFIVHRYDTVFQGLESRRMVVESSWQAAEFAKILLCQDSWTPGGCLF
jgi:hypothetical protein